MNHDFNLIAFGTDSYKMSHWNLYPEGTEFVYSYCEPRTGGRFSEVVFFGLHYIVSRYLAGQVVTREKIEEAAEVCKAHFGSDQVFNRKGWEHILETHQGRLPIKIKALPEGTVVPQGTCLFTIENTDPQVPWLTNYLETLLSQVWSPITVATSSREIRKIIAKYLDWNGTPEGLNFKLHDFGFRGVSSLETAALAGAAHLATGAMGTDTMAALALLRDYYSEPMAGFSIPATEHSIMTAGGPIGEADIVRRILKTHPTGLVAMVGDSYDMLRFVTDVIGQNMDIVNAIRNRQGTVIIRPDSGEIPEIDIEVFNALERVFGSSTNHKGFRVLPSQVRLIQGDGIKWMKLDIIDGGGWWHTTEQILNRFHQERISSDNIAFGSGGGLLQAFDRDTQRFAIKCSWMQVNGEARDIFKQPKTDSTKNSKRGLLAVVRNANGEIVTTQANGDWMSHGFENLLKMVFYNGQIFSEDNTLAKIRERAAIQHA
jgi:nicotinamide phosphoribosyltransferase